MDGWLEVGVEELRSRLGHFAIIHSLSQKLLLIYFSWAERVYSTTTTFSKSNYLSYDCCMSKSNVQRKERVDTSKHEIRPSAFIHYHSSSHPTPSPLPPLPLHPNCPLPPASLCF